jgi:hypothetical protein
VHPSRIEGAGDANWQGEVSSRGPFRAGVPQNLEQGTRAAYLGRRAFLACLLAALGALGPGRAWARGRPRELSDDPFPGLLRNPRSAAAVGARYVRDHPEERRAAIALAGACADEAREGWRWRRQLQLEGAQDFASGRVARVDGWVLSRTEARLCAAVWLAGHW